MAFMALKVVGSITPANTLNSRWVKPSLCHKMRKKAQCPNGTWCWAKRACKARV